ncbi:MAG: hypothetical protein LBI05_11290 [Planctomycetaceae bacterium]|nr:hypothetical protein [Planctomycetaceae bacterium]
MRQPLTYQWFMVQYPTVGCHQYRVGEVNLRFVEGAFDRKATQLPARQKNTTSYN